MRLGDTDESISQVMACTSYRRDLVVLRKFVVDFAVSGSDLPLDVGRIQ